MKTAVLVFAYNRPDHLVQTLDAIGRANLIPRYPVKIFIDGPKEGEQEASKQVLNVARNFKYYSATQFDVSIIFSEHNRGLALSITEAITKQFEYFDSIVVIEDDIILSPLALLYLEAMLNFHKDNQAIQSIALFAPVDDLVPVPYLTPRMMCWGWATWKDKWKRFLDKEKCQNIIENHIHLKEYYSYFVGMDSYSTLNKCIYEGKDVWACRWVLSHVIHQSFCLIPPKSLSINIGLDGSGQNCGKIDSNIKEFSSVTYDEIERHIRSRPFKSTQLMQIFAGYYDKQCCRTALDRDYPSVIESYL